MNKNFFNCIALFVAMSCGLMASEGKKICGMTNKEAYKQLQKAFKKRYSEVREFNQQNPNPETRANLKKAADLYAKDHDDRQSGKPGNAELLMTCLQLLDKGVALLPQPSFEERGWFPLDDAKRVEYVRQVIDPKIAKVNRFDSVLSLNPELKEHKDAYLQQLENARRIVNPESGADDKKAKRCIIRIEDLGRAYDNYLIEEVVFNPFVSAEAGASSEGASEI